MSIENVGKVLSIVVRPEKRGPVTEISTARATVDGGIDGDHPVAPNRGISFISSQQWKSTTGQLRAELPWHTRRANVLVDCPTLGHLIGKTVRVGDIEVEITQETHPCDLMDQLHMGLREALKPNCRGGVLGRISKAGAFTIGDTMTIVQPSS